MKETTIIFLLLNFDKSEIVIRCHQQSAWWKSITQKSIGLLGMYLLTLKSLWTSLINWDYQSKRCLWLHFNDDKSWKKEKNYFIISIFSEIFLSLDSNLIFIYIFLKLIWVECNVKIFKSNYLSVNVHEKVKKVPYWRILFTQSLRLKI